MLTCRQLRLFLGVAQFSYGTGSRWHFGRLLTVAFLQRQWIPLLYCTANLEQGLDSFERLLFLKRQEFCVALIELHIIVYVHITTNTRKHV